MKAQQVAAGPESQVIHPFAISRGLRMAEDYHALLADPAFIQQLIGDVAAIVERKNIEFFSFDVFDTALMRSTHSEARRFYTVSARFADQHQPLFTADDALLARSMAARAAYRLARPAADGTREGTLDLIATLVCAQLGFPALANDYVATELAFEEQHLTPNPMIIALIAAFPSIPCIFLSDMYLKPALIGRLLGRHFGDEIAVFSSADGNGSKRCGGLFAAAADRLSFSGARGLHFGDSLESDYRNAKRYGWNAYYLPISEAERSARAACHQALASTLAERDIALDTLFTFNC